MNKKRFLAALAVATLAQWSDVVHQVVEIQKDQTVA